MTWNDFIEKQRKAEIAQKFAGGIMLSHTVTKDWYGEQYSTSETNWFNVVKLLEKAGVDIDKLEIDTK